jgi:hypothetical protein
VPTRNRPQQFLSLRLTEDERNRLRQVARQNDRTLSSEARRALRFYLANVETAERVLRQQAEAVSS